MKGSMGKEWKLLHLEATYYNKNYLSFQIIASYYGRMSEYLSIYVHIYLSIYLSIRLS